jgi:hypothetical protein
LGSTSIGAKAGVIAGILYGIVLAVLSYVTLVIDKSQIISALTKSLPANSPFTAEQLYGIALELGPITAAGEGLIGGLIVGAIYGRVFERIPGKTSVIKGVLVGVVLWSFIGVFGSVGNLQYGAGIYLRGVGVDLLSALLFGVLLGYFFGRFSRPLDPAIHGYSDS